MKWTGVRSLAAATLAAGAFLLLVGVYQAAVLGPAGYDFLVLVFALVALVTSAGVMLWNSADLREVVEALEGIREDLKNSK